MDRCYESKISKVNSSQEKDRVNNIVDMHLASLGSMEGLHVCKHA